MKFSKGFVGVFFIVVAVSGSFSVQAGGHSSSASAGEAQANRPLLKALNHPLYLNARKEGADVLYHLQTWMEHKHFTLDSALPDLQKYSKSLDKKDSKRRKAAVKNFFTSCFGYSPLEKFHRKEVQEWSQEYLGFTRFRDFGILPDAPATEGTKVLVQKFKEKGVLEASVSKALPGKNIRLEGSDENIEYFRSLVSVLPNRTEAESQELFSKAMKPALNVILTPEHQEWVKAHLRSGYWKIPEQVRKSGFGKLVKVLVGTVLYKIDTLRPGISDEALEAEIFQAVQVGYYFGLAYPLVDDVMDSEGILTSSQKSKFTDLMIEGLSGAPVEDLKIPNLKLARDVKEIFQELRKLLPFEQNRDLYQSLLVLTIAQAEDQERSFEDPIESSENLMVPIMLKAAYSRIVSAGLVGKSDPKLSQHLRFMGIFNQFTDDLIDIKKDIDSKSFSAYVHYIKNKKILQGLKNPFEFHFGLAYFLADHYQSEGLKEVLLKRIVFALQEFYQTEKSDGLNILLDQLGLPKKSELRKVLFELATRKIISKDLEDQIYIRAGASVQKKFKAYSSDFEMKETLQDFMRVHLPLLRDHLLIEENDLRSPEDVQEKELSSAMNYALDGGGKRLRPMLVFLAAREFNISAEKIMPFAVGIEYAHTGSLIYDDLPAQDNAKQRRGRDAVHLVYRESTAQMAALDLVLDAVDKSLVTDRTQFDADSVIRATKYMVTTMGRKGLSLGQVKDLWRSEGVPTADEVKELVQLKTGLGIEASLIPPAILSHQSEETMVRLKQFAMNLGLVFQLRDDLLDIIGNQEKLGKDVKIDSQNQTPNFPRLFGKEETEKEIELHRQAALEDLKSLAFKSPIFAEIVNYAATRDH